MNTVIGWETTRYDYCIKQGAEGTVRFAFTVTKTDGTPLDSYDGFSAQLNLARRPNTAAEVQLSPTVTGDEPTRRLIVDLEFVTDTTKDVDPGNLAGDLVVIAPDETREYPVDFRLQVERSYGPVQP